MVDAFMETLSKNFVIHIVMEYQMQNENHAIEFDFIFESR
jgi:hypothetical protein